MENIIRTGNIDTSSIEYKFNANKLLTIKLTTTDPHEINSDIDISLSNVRDINIYRVNKVLVEDYFNTNFTFTPTGNNTLEYSEVIRSGITQATDFTALPQAGLDDVVATYYPSDNITIDYSLGSTVTLLHGSDIEDINFINIPSTNKNSTLTIFRVKDDSSTPRTINFPKEIIWSNNKPATLTQLPNAVDKIILMTFDGGVTWHGIGDESYVDAFVMTIDTSNTSTGSTDSSSFQLPTFDPLNGTGGGSGYDFVVDWGDGSSDSITTFDDPATAHTYGAPGVYTIKITGKFWGFVINNGLKSNGSVSGDKLKVINISQWGSNFRIGIGDSGKIGSFFYGASNLTITATDSLNVEGLLNFFRGFRACTSLTNEMVQPILDSIVTDKCTDLGGALAECTLNPRVYKWDTSSVQFIDEFGLDNTGFDQDISSFNLESVGSGFFLDMFSNAQLSVANYNAILLSLSKQDLPNSQSISFGTSQYIGQDSTSAKLLLEDAKSWTITDGGLATQTCNQLRLSEGTTVYSNGLYVISTTDAIPTTIFELALNEDSAVSIRGMVNAIRTGGVAGSDGDSASYNFFTLAKDISGTASLVGSVTLDAKEDQAGWDLTFTPSGGSILIQVTGAVDNDIDWNLFLETFTKE